MFTLDGGQITFPSLSSGEQHTSPAYSPDGTQIAFIDYAGTGNNYTIEVMSSNGTNQRAVLNSSAISPSAVFAYLTWMADGAHIALSVVDTTGGSYSNGGLWIVGADGTGLTKVFNNESSSEQTVFELDGSPTGNRIVFRCRYRTSPSGGTRLIDDYCIVDLDNNNALQRLPIDWTNSYPGSSRTLFQPHWTPDGGSVIFVNNYVSPDMFTYDYLAPGTNSEFTGTTSYLREEIFTIKADGSGLAELTHSPPIFYYVLTNGASGVRGQTEFNEALMSPDGQTIIANGNRIESSGYTTFGLWTANPVTGSTSLLTVLPRNGTASRNLDWQPIPHGLAFNILDGHTNPLHGIKVELRQLDGTVIDDQPINTLGGTYEFQNGLAPGDYILRATLADRCVGVCTPVFDIRYGPGTDEPVWLEWRFTVATLPTQPYTLNFSDIDPLFHQASTVATNRLDAMADICFRVRQYVDWTKSWLSLSTIPPVSFYAYAEVDPDGRVDLKGKPIDPNQLGAYYYNYNGSSKIVINSPNSDYANRDGLIEPDYASDGPVNDEWHEFTHHLYHWFVNDRGSCNPSCTNHLGYNNPDTCDSMDEGFASFLPMLAAGDFNVYVPLFYQVMVPAPTKAWHYRGSGETDEDFAVAGLFWDLVARNGNTESRSVIGADGLTHPVTYTNSQPLIPIDQLWTQLTSAHPATVSQLRASFGPTNISILFFGGQGIDLDGLYPPDVMPIDIPFLMHGFYPIDTDQTLTSDHKIGWYDVRYATLNGYSVPDGAVGVTSHHRFLVDGSETLPALIPRYKMPLEPHANIALSVLDASGQPLSGATLNMNISYPGWQQTISATLGGGSGVLLPLELPPYFDYLLPDNAPLPACDPLNDLHVTVTLTVEKDGQVSAQSPSFDNCAYFQAMAAATGPAALSFAFTVPVAGGGSIAPSTTPSVAASANPSVFGQAVTFTASVSAASGTSTPTGTVTFLDGGSPIGTGTLSGGVATFTTSVLSAGNHTITTSYGGNGSFSGSTGSLMGNPQVVNKANTTTTVTSSANPLMFGQSVTFTATASAVTPGAGTLTGTVTFLDGGNAIGTAMLSGGMATLTTSALGIGNRTITTTYGGDGNFNGSAGSFTGNPLVVNPAITTTTVGVSPGTVQYSDYTSFSATVNPASAGGQTLMGTVQFYLNGSAVGSAVPISSAGVATLSQLQLTPPAGTYPVNAVFSSTNANFSGSSGSITQTVMQEDAFILYSGDTIAQAGTSLTLRATVWDSAAAGFPGTNPETGSTTIGDITKMWIAFDTYPAASCGSGTPLTQYAQVALTSTAGVGTATSTLTSSSEASFCVVSRLVAANTGGTNLYYTAADAQVVGLDFYVNSGQFATGGGWVSDPSGTHGNFAFNARYNSTGSPKGQMVYVYRATYNGVMADFIIKSNALSALQFSGTAYPISSTLQGKANVQVNRAADGYTLFSAGNYTFSATVIDSGQTGTTGKQFSLAVYDSSGVPYHSIPAGTPLQGGNVVVHSK